MSHTEAKPSKRLSTYVAISGVCHERGFLVGHNFLAQLGFFVANEATVQGGTAL